MVIKITEKLKFYIPVEQAKARKAAVATVATLGALALIIGVVCAVLFFQVDRLTVEAGSAVTAEMLTGDPNAYFGEDFDPECVRAAGVYYFTVYFGGGAKQVCLKVVDTKAPDVVVKHIKWPVGCKKVPVAEDFIDSVVEAGDFSGYFVEELPEFKNMGEYRAKVRFEDASGNKTQVLDVYLELVVDNEAPKVELLTGKMTVALGYDPATAEKSIYEGIATVKDNCAGGTRFEVDDSGVNYNKKGRYTAYVYGYDMIGNQSEKVALTVDVEETVEGN